MSRLVLTCVTYQFSRVHDIPSKRANSLEKRWHLPESLNIPYPNH